MNSYTYSQVPNTSTTDRLPVIIASVTCSSTTGEVLPCILPVYDNGACSNALLEVCITLKFEYVY